MIIFFQILLMRFLVGMNIGYSLPVEYFSKDKFNRVGARIKFSKSTSEPVIHPVSGKITYYKYDYNSVTLMIFRGSMVIDHWKGNTLYTYHSSQFSPKGFWKKLKFMTTFFCELIRRNSPKTLII